MITFQSKSGMATSASVVALVAGLKHEVTFLDGATFEKCQVVPTVKEYLKDYLRTPDAEVIVVENYHLLNQNARDELRTMGLHRIIVRVAMEE